MSNRLPMPGEKPVGVWRPRSTRRRSPWLRFSPRLPIMLIVGAIFLTIGGLAWRGARVPVALVVNGETSSLTTHRRTVGGALRAAGITVDDEDSVVPPPETRLTPGMIITVRRPHTVLVHVDGQMLTTATRSNDPEAILAEMGIALGPHDAAYVTRATGPTPAEIADAPELARIEHIPREISVARAQTVIVNEGGARVSFETTQTTLGQALSAAGYHLYESDLIAPSLGTRVQPGLEVTITRATPVTLLADGLMHQTRTHQTMVGGLLNETGLALLGGDYTLPPPDTPLAPGETVRLVRVTEQVITEEEPVPYPTTYRPDPDLELDQQRVLQAGREGVRQWQARARYEDGVAVSRTLEVERITRPPQAQVIAYGTRIVIRELETPFGTLEYWRVLHVLATSYSPLTAGDKQPGDPFFGLSATGAEVVRGVVAVDPRVINLFTRMYIPGYGPGQALDTGGAVVGLRIDLGYDDANLVLWYDWVDIYLLTPVPPPDQIRWVLP